MEEKLIPLSKLQEGQRGLVKEILLQDDMRRRVQEFGFIPGSRVECLRRAPAGSPVAYGVLDAVVALRRKDAGKIRVLPWD